jgi:hypothetical protein
MTGRDLNFGGQLIDANPSLTHTDGLSTIARMKIALRRSQTLPSTIPKLPDFTNFMADGNILNLRK